MYVFLKTKFFCAFDLIISNEYKNGPQIKRIYNNKLESFWCHRAKIIKVTKIITYISQRFR